MVIAIGIAIAALVLGGALYYFSITKDTAFEKALQMAQDGQYADARGLIRSRLRREPEDYVAHHYMSRIYALEKDVENELLHLKEIKRINRYSPEVNHTTICNRLGELYYMMENFQESYENFFESHARNSKNREALTFLSFMAIGQGQFDLAENYFRQLVEVAPGISDYRVAYGVALAMQKNEKAMSQFEEGVKLKPDNSTARFMASLYAFRTSQVEKAREHLEKVLPQLSDPDILHLANRLAVGVYYMAKNYAKAFQFAEKCKQRSDEESWKHEAHDARLTMALMAILNGELEIAADYLTELEINNPTDEKIIRLSDFRMDLEEGQAAIDKVSPRGFDFFAFMVDWLRERFNDNTIYQISGLQMDVHFDILKQHTRDQEHSPGEQQSDIDPVELVARFNALRGDSFQKACETIVNDQGYKIVKYLPNREKDGADLIASNLEDPEHTALFRFRQWSDQPISDIFVRNMQNFMNELKVRNGFVLASARLTSGAEQAMKSLSKITVINDHDFGVILKKMFSHITP